MKQVILSLRDSKLAEFKSPMFGPTVPAIVRSVQDAVNSKDAGDLSAHPEDFEVFSLGTYDTDNGLFDTGVPVSVVHCSSLVRG